MQLIAAILPSRAARGYGSGPAMWTRIRARPCEALGAWHKHRQEDMPVKHYTRTVSGGPCSRAVRVTGTLDTISASRNTIVLMLAGGHVVPARLMQPEIEMLRILFATRS
jgi:hypothetical protein